MSLLAALMARPGNLKLQFPAAIQLDFRRVGSTLLKLGVGKSQRKRAMRALRSSRGWLRQNLGSSNAEQVHQVRAHCAPDSQERCAFARGSCTALGHEDLRLGATVTQEAFVQIVVSQLKESATREEFVELHRQTAEWMAEHPDCLSYEVFEGSKGAIADRIVWSSKAGALRANEEYARTEIAADMQRIVASYTNFFGTPVLF